MKVLIVDDEKPARDRLRQILADEDDYEVVGEAANGHEALAEAARVRPDIVLLDIRMPGMEGIETAHHLNAMMNPPAVVIMTAGRACSSALSEAAADARLNVQRKHVCAHAHGELKLIPVNEVTAFLADQKYVSVDHDNGQDLIDDSLKSLEAEFGDRFVRIHRSALVAVERIDRVEKNDEGKSRIVLRDGSQVEDKELIISRRHVAEVKRRLKES